MPKTASKMEVQHLELLILHLRGMRVMVDSDLARIYGVSTKQLNQQVKRNRKRFPSDFAFQLTAQEFRSIRSQNVTASKRAKAALPWVFTEHGAIMLASVLNSELAMEASVRVTRAFVRLRQILAGNEELAGKLAQVERKLGGHDEAIEQLFSVLRKLLEEPGLEDRREIGFHVKDSAVGI
jgi:hypothetical protein